MNLFLLLQLCLLPEISLQASINCLLIYLVFNIFIQDYWFQLCMKGKCSCSSNIGKVSLILINLEIIVLAGLQ